MTDLFFTRAYQTYEFDGAFRCIYQSYHKRGLTHRISHEMRLTRYHLLPSTCVFVARHGSQVVGTLSMVEDGPLGVPMRAVFGRHIDDLVRSRFRIAEATCLAVREAPQPDLAIVHRLMGLVAQSARRRGISRVVIAVHPRHAPFYARWAGFRTFTPVIPYPTVNGKLAVAMDLDLASLHINFPDVYRRYFGYTFPEVAVSPFEVEQDHLQRITAHWRAIHDESPDADESAPLTAPGVRVAAA